MLELNDRVEGYERTATAPVKVATPARVKAKRKMAKSTGSAIPTVTAPAPQPVASVKGWATFGVVFTLALSALLNGYANAQHAPLAFAGWLMGLSVPVLVLVLSKVAGEKYRAGQKPVAWLAGGSGIALLFLSVWHCSQSIALLTGSGLILAVPLALAIDMGLVSCEIALITEPRD